MTIQPPQLLPLELVARAAFELLASSSSERYRVIALRLASVARIYPPVGQASVEYLLGVAERLWRRVLGTDARQPEEFELAILLGVLFHHATPSVDEFMSKVGIHDEPSSAWISALCRALLARRAENTLHRYRIDALPSFVIGRSRAQRVEQGLDSSTIDWYPAAKIRSRAVDEATLQTA